MFINGRSATLPNISREALAKIETARIVTSVLCKRVDVKRFALGSWLIDGAICGAAVSLGLGVTGGTLGNTGTFRTVEGVKITATGARRLLVAERVLDGHFDTGLTVGVLQKVCIAHCSPVEYVHRSGVQVHVELCDAKD